MLLQSSPLLTRQDVAVSSQGENVILRIGNTDIPMHYEHALSLSSWVREEARIIKRATGRGKSVRMLGIPSLDERLKPLPRQPGTAIHVKEKLATYHRGDVTSDGRLVCTKIGPHTIRLHFESALKVSQWLRLRAKEARNRAGDTRHWTTIGNLEDL